MSDERALQRAVADACLGLDAGEDLTGDLRGFLQARGVSGEDVDAILAAPRRLAVYRSLVRNGIADVVSRILPRTREWMNARCDGRFDRDLARFLDGRGARTHYLRDVPAEFFDWAGEAWKADHDVPSYLCDLASYELAFFGASTADRAAATSFGEIALDRPLAFDPSARLVRLAWAVHRIGARAVTDEAPEPRPVTLLAYRDADHSVRFLELTPVAAAVVDGILRGVPLATAVQDACAALSATFDPAETARLLADLGDRGVLLGAEARASTRSGDQPVES